VRPRPTAHIGHSPDPDDAFMFYALAHGKFDTTPEVYEHHLVDIETLNHAAARGQHEVTAISFHAYAYVADKYVLLPHGASFGDNYGPLLVARDFPGSADPLGKDARAWLAGKTVAVPGLRTSAHLALQMFGRGVRASRTASGKLSLRDTTRLTRPSFTTEVVFFDQIIPRVAAGQYDAGLVIHEGQLTYHEPAGGGLKKVLDLGEWWGALTGLPLPLGGNVIRRDLGPERMRRISSHLKRSIQWGLAHRAEALAHAMKYARNMGSDKADEFVGMYVNDYTLDAGAKGRASVQLFLEAGQKLGLVPGNAVPEWAD